MDRQELIDTIAEDLFSYAMAGHIDVDAVANGLKPQGLADRYVDYELLVRLHFILLPAVIDFVDQLPDRLRHIKTESAHTQLDAHGEIRGRINWPATLAQRSQTAPGTSDSPHSGMALIQTATCRYQLMESSYTAGVMVSHTTG